MSEPTIKIPTGKAVDLPSLLTELRAAQVGIASLGSRGDDLIVYDATGQPMAWPPEAVTVLEAHTPPPPPEKIYLGTDVTDDQGYRMADAATTLRTYLNDPSPTAARDRAALKVLIRVVLFVLKHRLGF